jgi:hypothetical protein
VRLLNAGTGRSLLAGICRWRFRPIAAARGVEDGINLSETIGSVQPCIEVGSRNWRVRGRPEAAPHAVGQGIPMAARLPGFGK